MKALVQRRDGELVVVIPEQFAKDELIEEGSEVVVQVVKRWRLAEISAIDPTAYMTLEEMIEQITPETLHEYVDMGPPVGKEVG